MDDPLDDRLAHMGEAGELPQLGAALARHRVGGDAVIAVEIRHLRIDEGVALDLAEKRRAMTANLNPPRSHRMVA